jgi:site-specific DNA-methyltransferase (adenine-specific)
MTTASCFASVEQRTYADAQVSLYQSDALALYAGWPSPDVIVCDGPYGLRSFPGDPAGVDGLPAFYRPHALAWAERAKPSTTLWFWCSELGWATVHPLLELAGWQYVRACVWDKGPGHVAGNANSKTLRQLPAVTELCVQYVRRVVLPSGGGSGDLLPMKAWLRAEWLRSGLTLARTNHAAGVANAATRKWFTACHLWYAPPGEAVERLAGYANRHGDPRGRPYFSLDGEHSASAAEWDALRATFHCPPDRHNVWRHPAVRGAERIRIDGRTGHMNQKPLALVRDSILWTTNPGDVVWEPFAGTATALASAILTGRRGVGAEIREPFYAIAAERLNRAEADR